MSSLEEFAGIPDRREIVRRIERLEIPSDLKALLAKLLDASIEVGGKIIEVGRRVIAFIFDLARSYPNIAFGVIVALVLSLLIGSIPILGPIISPILTPILLIVGLGYGALQDMADGAMRTRVSILEKKFTDLGVA